MSGFQSSFDHYTDGDGPLDGDNTEDLNRNDGHIYAESGVDDYWIGTKHIEYIGWWQIFSLVPAGRVMVVLEDDPDAVQHGWLPEQQVQTGVYLAGRDRLYRNRPPTPVAVDDDHLRFAADACLRAADGICGDKTIIALSKAQRSSLTIFTTEADEEEILFYGGDDPGPTSPEEQPELYRGFYRLRERPAPAEIYSECEFPRLNLGDVGYFSDGA